MKRKQLVMIRVTFRDANGNPGYKIGTGYFITPTLVLTSRHVLPAVKYDRLEVRVEKGELENWFDAEIPPRWESPQLDAALIKVKTRIEIEEPVLWEENPQQKGIPLNWHSDGYPEASKWVNEAGQDSYTTRGLNGSWNPFGGMGQAKISRLDLEISARPADPGLWAGISGAPVFIENSSGEERLIGIIRNVPTNFPDRLEGVPAYELLKDAGFVAALEEDQFEIPEDDNWALILVSDNPNKKQFTGPVQSAIDARMGKDCKRMLADINDVLEKPGTLLNFIQVICRAPVMFIDATDFQPGIMVLLGIRSVVRRGVTIVATIRPIEASVISTLPFNIQEIKLVTLHVPSYPLGNIGTPKDRLIDAMKNGRTQLLANPGYLDLPPFDAIRKPVVVDIPAIKEKILLLCPFSQEKNHTTGIDQSFTEAKPDHKMRFNFIRNEITNLGKNTEDIVRMLDITSPQLVGQSLYEHIRWCNVCIIDWSNWRPNVFYELGVRLAASDIAPINLIGVDEMQQLQEEVTAEKAGTRQQELLIRLLEPHVYDIPNSLFPAEVSDYLDHIQGGNVLKDIAVNLSRIYPTNIYFTVEKYFDWNQENMQNLPHQNIKRQMEREFGKELAVNGRYNILYSSNKGFKDAIENQRREYWLCAWYYFYNRYLDEFQVNPAKRIELVQLGEIVMDALDLESYKSIKKQITKIIEENEN